MDSWSQVTVHESEFPDRNRELLCQGLKERDLSSKFLYQSPAQTSRWLQLHRACSPAVLDPSCARIYEEAFQAASSIAAEAIAHVISIGCGGGQKDARLLRKLREAGKTILYTPADTSLSMVLTAQEAARNTLRGLLCQPLVFDLPACSTLPAILKSLDPAGSQRIIAFFGMLHTFEPRQVLPRIMNSVRSQDCLLVSVNMAPEENYHQAVQNILPQYDNHLTRQWLLGAMIELGFSQEDGEIRVAISPGHHQLQKFEARFHFTRECQVELGGETFTFSPADSIRLFYSYRYTPPGLAITLDEYGLEIVQSWIAPAREEGIFLCRRKP